MKQIEEWAVMKIGNVLFGSSVDNWDVNNSDFDERISNECDLIFLIGDEGGYKFGCYVNAMNNKKSHFIKDPNAFEFSLKSNGRLNRMTRFGIKDSKFAFRV